jgi:hypothetical protein
MEKESMYIHSKEIDFFLWRIVAVICFLAWLIVFIAAYHYMQMNDIIMQNNDFISPLVSLCIISLMILGTAYLVVFPTKFVVYGILCIIISLVQIVDGGGLPGILMFFLGLLFINKVGFFKKHKIIKITALSALLFLGICTQYRYGTYKLSQTLLHLFCFALISFIAFILYFPELRTRKKDAVQTVIRLPSDEFTHRDISILKSIQQGEKYEAIAKNEDIALSTLKVRLRFIFNYLKVYDKNTFLTKYVNHHIILETIQNRIKGDAI